MVKHTQQVERDQEFFKSWLSKFNIAIDNEKRRKNQQKDYAAA
jgi:hypothetical protein